MFGTAWLMSPVRRCIDVAVSAGLLVVVAPLIAATALAVRVRLGSPVLFRQQRAGLNGEPFELLKFRTMTSEVDDDGALLADDVRLTAFGTWLRATSLDELPQLCCVFRGHMSLIGPRPLLLHYEQHYTPDQRRRLEARPGLTGWAQVNGRNGVDWPAKLARDVEYIERASLLIDLIIAIRTPVAILGRRGITDGQTVTSAEFAAGDVDVDVDVDRKSDGFGSAASSGQDA